MTSHLVVSPDPEKAVTDVLAALMTTGQPLAGWRVGTRTPPNETPASFIQVRQLDGDNPQVLLYRWVVQLRAWHPDEGTAKRQLNAALAHLRRALGVRVTAVPVPLPDSVDSSRNYYQAAVQVPMIGVAP